MQKPNPLLSLSLSDFNPNQAHLVISTSQGVLRLNVDYRPSYRLTKEIEDQFHLLSVPFGQYVGFELTRACPNNYRPTTLTQCCEINGIAFGWYRQLDCLTPLSIRP